jgi:lysine 6-dehydrogenase
MTRILVAGCGLMGPAVAKDCCESEDVTKVVGCDIDETQLKRCTQHVSNEKFERFKLDLNDHEALSRKMKGFDVVVNASAARFSSSVVKAAIKTGVDVVDLTSAS